MRPIAIASSLLLVVLSTTWAMPTMEDATPYKRSMEDATPY
jgi:hypothetical protein